MAVSESSDPARKPFSRYFRALRALVRRAGFDIVRFRERAELPPDFSSADRRAFEAVREFTGTSPERVFSLIEAVRYLVRSGVEGDFVECGVWRGGSVMAMAKALLEEGVRDRRIFLFDTFEGMTAPGAEDRSLDGSPASEQLKSDRRGTGVWCEAGLPEVTENIRSTGYPMENVKFVVGPVEKTIPASAPEKIALLRLDTDWYESTRHELNHLFPRVADRGVVLIDDYGHWQGARRAVDEFLTQQDGRYLLQRIDYTGRLLIKH